MEGSGAVVSLFSAIILSGLLVGSDASCVPGDRTAIDGACSSYLECSSSGEEVLKSCGVGKNFNPARLECDWTWRLNCTDKAKECDDGKTYSHPDSCRLYYTCNAGRLTLNFCPLLEVFNPSTGTCKFGITCPSVECSASARRAAIGDCSSYEECSDGKWSTKSCFPLNTYDVNTQSCKLGGCSQCTEGDLSKGSACNKYQQCFRGAWEEQSCSMFKRFDPVKKECVWFFQYRCPITMSLMAEPVGCNNGDVRAEDDCSKYSICSNGKWELFSCPGKYLFDEPSSECVLSDQAQCHACQEDSASETSCKQYYSCDKGAKVSKSCGLFKNWDGVSKKCVFWGANCFPGEKCTENGRRVATDDCKTYKECRGGNFYKDTCWYSRVYDAQKAKCVWVLPWYSCPKTLRAQECVEGETKTLNCERYVKCIEGRWTEQRCNSGETFSKGSCLKQECLVEKKSCTSYSINGIDMECESGEIFDEYKKKCVPGKCRHARDVDECEDGFVQDINGRCDVYNLCISGKFVEQTCPECTNFDPNNKKCKPVWSYPCKRAPSTEPNPLPTSESTEPTPAPSSASTEPSPVPTSASTEPSPAPSSASTEPSPVPTSASTEPSPSPTSASTEPSPDPTSPSTEPSPAPTSASTEPSPVPTSPSTEPSPAPTSASTEPSPVPTSPSTEPSPDPTSPSTEPSPAPTSASTEPSPVPTSPSTEPSPDPTSPSTEPSPAPTSPTEPSSGPPSPSTEPTPAPTSPSTEPPAPSCTEGEKKPNKEDCQKYFVCKNGQFVPDKCMWPREFDSVELTCKWWGAKCA